MLHIGELYWIVLIILNKVSEVKHGRKIDC